MRVPILALALVAAALLGEARSASAQSAYSYPWCAVYGFRSTWSCYYTSYQQCWTTQWGIGGQCVPSPYYRGPAVVEQRASRRHRHR